MRYPYPVKPRRLATRVIEGTQQLLLASILTFLVFRLGNMQLEGLLAFGGATSALLFGFTSLQFNRTRAYSSGPTQRRSLVVAELALRSTLSFVMGAAITAMIFTFLTHSSYVPTPAYGYPHSGSPHCLRLGANAIYCALIHHNSEGHSHPFTWHVPAN